MYSILLQWAKVAGIAGMAFGTLLLIYRAVIGKLRTPDSTQSGAILRLIVILTFAIGTLGILVYAAIVIFVPEDQRSAYDIDNVLDTVDFTHWTPVNGDPVASYISSTVLRTRLVRIRKLVRTDSPFYDRYTTTGKAIILSTRLKDATFREVTPKSGRTSHEYLLSLPPESFGATGSYTLYCKLVYTNGWVLKRDNWVGKVIQYPTRSYHFVLTFPTPWTWAQVRMQPPGSTENLELANEHNSAGSLTYEWSSGSSQVLKPGTRIVVYFGWPPLTGSST